MGARVKKLALRASLLGALGLIASPVSIADRFTLPGALNPLARPEPILAQVFGDIEVLRIDRALDRLDAMLQSFPNFRLGHLIKGDLLLARGRPLATFGNADYAPPDRVAELRDEAIARVKAYRDKPPANSLPRALVQLQPAQKHALVVDTLRSRLYVFENDHGRPRYVSDYYITQGSAATARHRSASTSSPTVCRARSWAISTAAALSRSIIRTNGTAASAATATASGCTARRATPSRGHRAPRTAASCCRTPTSTKSRSGCRSASRR